MACILFLAVCSHEFSYIHVFNETTYVFFQNVCWVMFGKRTKFQNQFFIANSWIFLRTMQYFVVNIRQFKSHHWKIVQKKVIWGFLLSLRKLLFLNWVVLYWYLRIIWGKLLKFKWETSILRAFYWFQWDVNVQKTFPLILKCLTSFHELMWIFGKIKYELNKKFGTKIILYHVTSQNFKTQFRFSSEEGRF